MAATAESVLWNQRAASVHSSPEPVVSEGDRSSTRLNVPPSTAAYSLPPGPPSGAGFAKREQPPSATHSTISSMCRVPAGAVNTRPGSELNASGQSFESGVGWHDRNGAPSTVPPASAAGSV